MDLQDEGLNLGSSKLFPKTNNTSSIRSKYLLYLRKASLLFLLVSLLSFFLSFFTGLAFHQSYTYYFSTFLLPFLIQSFQRKYMFLLCNSILVFLAGKSVLHGASSLHSELQPQDTEPDDVHKVIMNAEENLMFPLAAPVHPQYEEETDVFVGDEQLKTQAKAAAEDPVMREANQVGDLPEDGELDEEIVIEDDEENGSIIVGGEEDTAESEGPASNTEELNEKIDEFIRKMKKELQLEAQQQQLIAA